jgi:hypothetical protein
VLPKVIKINDMEIEVRFMGYCNFEVTLSDGCSESKHITKLTDVYYNRLAKGKISKEELIKRSFEFLLKKEPGDSILPKFDLREIKKYFPDYEDNVQVCRDY